MPPYVTQGELEARVGGEGPFLQLTDDDADDTPDAEVIALFLTEFDAELNSYFRAGGYTVPLSEAAFSGVKRFALDIANYRLKTRGDREASEGDRQLYEDAVAFLKLIATRKVLLEVVSASARAYPVLESEDVLFDRTTLRTM